MVALLLEYGARTDIVYYERYNQMIDFDHRTIERIEIEKIIFEISKEHGIENILK